MELRLGTNRPMAQTHLQEALDTPSARFISFSFAVACFAFGCGTARGICFSSVFCEK
jgi:hypothetical protein